MDPSGNADHTTIQAAINDARIGSNPTQRFTVLIYAGTYAENVQLGTTKENVDLVGVDRDSVIIAPSSGTGLTITSGTEAARNNRIANLTIKTTDGHGIEIVKGAVPGAQDPAEFEFGGLVLSVAGTGRIGISGAPANGVAVNDCQITTADGDAIIVGNDWSVSRTSANALNGKGISANGKTQLRIRDCTISAVDANGLHLVGRSSEVSGANSTFERRGGGGPFQGAFAILDAEHVHFKDCTFRHVAGDLGEHPVAIFGDSEGLSGSALFDSCMIEAVGGPLSVTSNALQIDNGVAEWLFLDCEFRALNSQRPVDSRAEATGLAMMTTTGAADVTLIGGSVYTASSSEREELVYDVKSASPNTSTVAIRGTRLTKWNGPVMSSGRARSYIQRVLDVSPASTSSVAGPIVLTASEQEITTGISQPDVYRALTITGDTAGMNQDVFVIGSNFGGEQIVDKITLAGTATVVGEKPFASVTKIVLPAGSGQVSVGASNVLGLQAPIASASDVLEISKRSSTASTYQVVSLSAFAIGVDRSTVTPDSIQQGESFELVFLAHH